MRTKILLAAFFICLIGFSTAAVAKTDFTPEKDKLFSVFVSASDANTLQPLADVTLQISDYQTNVLVQKITFSESALVSLAKGDYRFLFTKTGYGAFEKIVAVKKGSRLIEVQALMKDYRIKGKLRFNYALTVRECPAGHNCAISGQLRFSVASGGIGNIKDLKKLSKIGVAGVIIGKAIYEKKIKLSDLKNL